jgi:hypothetical protein
MSPDEAKPAKDDEAPVYSTRQVRQGDVVLRKPWERGVFIAGLAGAVVLAIVIIFAVRFSGAL